MSYRYSAMARTLHWLIAAMVLLILTLGVLVVYVVPDTDEKLSYRLYLLHESLGFTILPLMLLRAAYRHWHPPAPLPSDVPRMYHTVGHANYILLYVLLLMQPMIGLLRDNTANFQLDYFGIVRLPLLTGKNDALAHALSVLHWYVGMAIAALIVAHIGGALFHALVRRDGVLRRML
jgi:cytochrome b561